MKTKVSQDQLVPFLSHYYKERVSNYVSMFAQIVGVRLAMVCVFMAEFPY